MGIPDDIADAIHAEFLKAKKILFISHRHPDGDTVGSNLALRLFAEEKGIAASSACADHVNARFAFLPLSGTFIDDFTPSEYDLLVCLDCGSPDQTVFLTAKNLLNPSDHPKIINIDHHPTNTLYGDINLVIETAASTTQIIFNLLKEWNHPIDPKTATCLLAGLYTDTGSFMHSNTCDSVLETAGELVGFGADRHLIVKNLFKDSSPERLLLLGKILETANMTEKNVVISALSDDDINSCGGDSSELGGAIDYLNCVKGNRIAALLTEDGNGNIRGSLRTKDDNINLCDIAKKLGGGGHRKASGFTIKGRLQKEVHWTIRPR